MDLSTLAIQLKEDAARNLPPFGAASVEMARELGPRATDPLLREISAHGDTAFLALEALREADPVAYDALPPSERADIYAEALSDTIFFNAWGVPNYQLSSTSEALIALGDEAIQSLKSLLTDCRSAPLRGSHEGTVSSSYENRLCDYAWILISEIMRRPYSYAQLPAERDQAIQALHDELNEKSGHE